MKKLNYPNRPLRTKRTVEHGNRNTIPFGGQHRSPQGVSTKDKTDEQDNHERLADFNAALELAKFGTLADRAW
jgi:hypothetical protein